MELTFWLPLFLTVLYSSEVYNQQNAGSSVSPALIRCYNESEFLDANRRLPASLNVYIEMIRKIENGRSAQDARQLATELIHR